VAGFESDSWSPHELEEVVHGTTVATNAVLERRGGKTALVTTAGFRDVLELRRMRMPHMYDLFWRKPPPLVPRHLRFEVAERVAADGTVLVPLDEAEVAALAGRIAADGVRAVAICFLHSYIRPEHEERAAAVLRAELPEVEITCSSEILREQGEYERTATTVVNAYVRPLMSSYLDRIRTGLDDLSVTAPLMIMQSSGGVMSAEDARRRPVLALESGPASGVVAAVGMAERLGWGNVISFDMGGTTAKASLIEAGAVSRGREYEAGGSLSSGSRLIRGSGELLRIPTIDLAEVGAGGGSIAWIDEGGALQVGPRSAGALPGPACYGLGGTDATVTDANVVLGYVPSGAIADGGIEISAERALAAVTAVADAIGTTPAVAAEGVHRLANARMMRALRAVSSEKGRDPREFALLAYGGSGPVHAAGLADDLGIRTVLVPALAGLFSAVGLLFARPEFHDVRTCQLDPRDGHERVTALLADLRAGLERLVGDREVETWQRSADLRYRGQSWEIEVDLPAGDVSAGTMVELVERFEDDHERLYGVRAAPGAPVEMRAVRLAALGRARGLSGLQPAGAPPRPAGGERRASFAGVVQPVAVRARASVGPEPEPGPLLVDEYDTTVVVPPGWTARLDAETQTLVLER
jgi:N-methylhydantoinase A